MPGQVTIAGGAFVGKLIGVGVGPGDPELMTLKAIRLIKECDCIIIPASEKEKCIAYKIAEQAIPEIAEKEVYAFDFPMTSDKNRMLEEIDVISEKIINILKKKKNAVFLTLGDATIYSTFMYVLENVKAAGIETEIVSGITSFCAAAARIQIAIGSGNSEIHIISGNDDIEHTSKYRGTRVYMKSGRQLGRLKEYLVEESKKKPLQIYTINNCGMESEEVTYGAEQINADAGYFTIVIVKEANQPAASS